MTIQCASVSQGVECGSIPAFDPPNCLVKTEYQYIMKNVGTASATLDELARIRNDDTVNVIFFNDPLEPGDEIVYVESEEINVCDTQTFSTFVTVTTTPDSSGDPCLGEDNYQFTVRTNDDRALGSI